MSLPWTKFQDFYLRLGFLKAIVAVLSPQRRSAHNDVIVRKLQTPLFDPVQNHGMLWSRVRDRMTWHDTDSDNSGWKLLEKKKKKKKEITVAEALLVDGNCPSFLFAITGPTTYKITDWARDVALLGRANQITERGILLRHLLDEASIGSFLAGDVNAWNPFILTVAERLFFLFHLIQIDEVILELIGLLAARDPTDVLESRDAGELTCSALINVLSRAKDTVQPRDLPAFRIASELTATIADELNMHALASNLVGGARPRVAKSVRPKARNIFSGGTMPKEPRHTTKNADHQTIPRFEQLVDLGFLRKPSGNTSEDSGAVTDRRRWRYVPTEACRRWAVATNECKNRKGPFRWNSFASVCLKTFYDTGNVVRPKPHVIALYLWKAYERIRRPAGQNPLDSIALFAMLLALSDGIAIEIADFHGLMLKIKQASTLPHHVFFASGNEIDQMFIQLKPGFVDEVQKNEAMFAVAGAT